MFCLFRICSFLWYCNIGFFVAKEKLRSLYIGYIWGNHAFCNGFLDKDLKGFICITYKTFWIQSFNELQCVPCHVSPSNSLSGWCTEMSTFHFYILPKWNHKFNCIYFLLVFFKPNSVLSFNTFYLRSPSFIELTKIHCKTKLCHSEKQQESNTVSQW